MIRVLFVHMALLSLSHKFKVDAIFKLLWDLYVLFAETQRLKHCN